MKPSHGLESIPGIGRSIAQNLRDIGIHEVLDLVGRDPYELYHLSNVHESTIQDRCLLYVFRCAVYYAQGGRDPDWLKWWKWKDA